MTGMDTENQFPHLDKTKMCKFHALGKCKKGKECTFAHSSEELRPLPDLHSTKLCKSFILTGICTDENCVHAHSNGELHPRGSPKKTKWCRFERTGHKCNFGSKCNFAHSKSELCDTDDDSYKFEEAQLPQQGTFLPPGLGWEDGPSPLQKDYTDIHAMKKDIADLKALAQMFDGMLSQLGQVAGLEPACEVQGPQPQAKNLAYDLPAYVHVTADSDDWSLSTVSSQPIEKGRGFGQLSFDSSSCDGQSISSRSSASPLTPPSPTGSGRGSETAFSQAMPEMCLEGAYKPPLTAGGLCNFRPTNGFPHLAPELYGGDPRLAIGPFGSIMGA